MIKKTNGIMFGLCGNEYSASIQNLAFSDKFFLYQHKSNSRSLYRRAVTLLRLFLLYLIRIFCRLSNIKFSLCIPHQSNTYAKYLKIFKPDNLYLVDDGITFIYWSSFHENYILPLLKDLRLKGIVGAEQPVWKYDYKGIIEVSTLTRKSVVENMIISFSRLKLHSLRVSINHYIVVIDDGMQDLGNSLDSKVASLGFDTTNIIIILHPSRKKNVLRERAFRLSSPIECFIVQNIHSIKGVVGFGSTALLNIISLCPSFPVISIGGNNLEIDNAMSSKGVFVKEMN